MNKFKFLILLTFLSLNSFAEITLPSIFTDGMVIQQNSKNLIWGWAEPNEKVYVNTSWCGVQKSTIADSEGNWELFIGTPEHNTNQKIVVKGSNTITIKDVSIGEVWLAVGQSNMHRNIGRSFNWEEEVDNALDKDMKFFYAPSVSTEFPSIKQEGNWLSATEVNEEYISAISFYFADKIYDNINVPIGIIVEAYGGTPVEAWMPLSLQMDSQSTMAYIAEDSRQRIKHEELSEERRLLYESDPIKYKRFEIRPPFEAKAQYPGATYNGMINPIVGYGIKGMIYYQGENNAVAGIDRAIEFSTQLPKLINYYREIWSERTNNNVDSSFPFYFVQLPSWRKYQVLPVENDVWPVARESMLKIATNTVNTELVVTIDTGDSVDIHPFNKKPIGIRLAYHALKNEYSKAIVNQGPVYVDYLVNGTDVELNFETQGANIVSAKEGDINTFAVAGSDEVWYWADNVVINGNKITVSSSQVSSPVAVRYAWALNPSKRNLIYNEFGMPASPFRTDDWTISTTTYQKGSSKPSKDYIHIDWDRPEMPQ